MPDGKLLSVGAKTAIPFFCLILLLSIIPEVFPLNGDIPEENLISLISGQMKTIKLQDASDRIDIGTRGIIDVFMPDKKSLAVKAEAPGFTTVMVRYANGVLETYGITVSEETPQYITKIAEQLKKELEPVQGITIASEGSKVVINGTIGNQAEIDYFKKIVSMYRDFVLDLTGTYVAEPVSTGERTDIVQIDVRVVQISDTDETNIGIQWFNQPWQVSAEYGTNWTIDKQLGKDKQRTWTNKTGTQSPVYTLDKPHKWDKDIKYAYGISLNNVAIQLIALAKDNKVKFLATPRLIVQSGKTASFQVGGQIPIAQSTAFVADVDWKDYGTTLEISPRVLDDGRIFINLNADMSELDWANGIGQYPAITTKQAETNLTARDGETFAIAGLISQEITDTVSKVPLLGDIPLVGLIFRSKDKKVVNTETIVFFTPHIITTTSKGAIKPSEQLDEVMSNLEKARIFSKSKDTKAKASKVKMPESQTRQIKKR